MRLKTDITCLYIKFLDITPSLSEYVWNCILNSFSFFKIT